MSLGLYGFKEHGNLQIDRAEAASEIWRKSDLLLKRVIKAGLGEVSSADREFERRQSARHLRAVTTPFIEVKPGDHAFIVAIRGQQRNSFNGDPQATDWETREVQILQRLKDDKPYKYASVSIEAAPNKAGAVVQYYNLAAGAQYGVPVIEDYGLDSLFKTDKELLISVGSLATQIEAQTPGVSI